MTNVLVVAPHWDDEVVGCGGSLYKLARAGHDVTVVSLIERGRSSLDTGTTDDDFRAEVAAAHDVLGVRHHVSLDQPERGTSVSRRLLLDLVGVLRDTGPEIVFVPHEDEDDTEHRLANAAARDALWMASSEFFAEQGPPVAPPRLVLAYEVWTPLARPSYVQPLDDAALGAKIAAIRCFASQVRLASWDAAVSGLAAYRGTTAFGGGYAEAFDVLRLGGPIDG